MRTIFEQSQAVLIWLGRDSREYDAKAAIASIRIISDFLCQKLGIEASELRSIKVPLHDYLVKRRELLPLPNECEFSNDALWESLRWFYSRSYFTRVWIIQELSVPGGRVVHCGNEMIEWEHVDLVAGYIIMETAFSKAFGFSNTHCWWAASLVQITHSESWLFMLYLASNYYCLDARDFIYSLRDLMKLSDGGNLLIPDYSKTMTEVYMDSVEAALIDFKNTDVLYYVGGTGDPSWVPQWNKAMLFRNPFRLTSGLPWKPAADTVPIWSIDRKNKVLSLSGILLDTVEYSEPYNEGVFGTTMTLSAQGRNEMKEAWTRILKTFEKKFPIPLDPTVILAAAVSFSFGLNEKKLVGTEHQLMLNFIAYLKAALEEDIFSQYISRELKEESENADGTAFGKPVWDFEYPESSVFITKDGLVGCAVALTRPGDIAIAALGSSYPHVLRQDNENHRIRGYCYIHGVMKGERKDYEVHTFHIC